jgi:hypothetical protein
VLGYRAMGRQPVSPSGQEPAKSAGPDEKRASAAPSDVDSPELAALGTRRMDLAKKMLDSAFRLYQEGEMSVVDYLAAQKRHDEVVADVTVKTDADRIRFLERQVTTLKQIEDRTRELFRRALVTQVDGDLAELARLDAEYALAKLKAKVRGQSDGRAPSQNVPE